MEDIYEAIKEVSSVEDKLRLVALAFYQE